MKDLCKEVICAFFEIHFSLCHTYHYFISPKLIMCKYVLPFNTYSALQLLAEIDFEASGTSPALFAVHPQITDERNSC